MSVTTVFDGSRDLTFTMHPADPAFLFCVFVAWHGLKLGAAGYLYFAYGDEYFSKCGDPEKEAAAEAEHAVVVKGFATGDLSPDSARVAESKLGRLSEDGDPGVRLANRRVAELKKLA